MSVPPDYACRSGEASRPLVAISSCLLGESVRYNGEHQRAPVLLAELAPHVRWLSICPELEVGMGVPREPVHLVEPKHLGAANATSACRMVGVETGRDWTRDMEQLTSTRLRDPELLEISGYIFKSRSPSCGVANVPLRTMEGAVVRQVAGLFAAAVKRRFSDIPLAEETDLVDQPSCRRFLERVLAHWRRHRPDHPGAGHTSAANRPAPQ